MDIVLLTFTCNFWTLLPSILQSAWAFSWNRIYKFFLNFGMVPETHLKLCVTKLDFLKKNFWSQNLWKRTKIWTTFEFIGKFIHYFLLNLFNNEFTQLCAVFLQKSRVRENFYSWGVGQNVLSQSDCRNFYQPYLQNKSVK